VILDDNTFRRLCRAREVLACTAQPVQIAAREAAMSPFHFIRRFEAVFGLTPHQFRIARRMERAKQLLATGQRSVTETCMELGMTSLGTFSDLFLRHVGDRPSDYQRRARTLVQVQGQLPAALFPGCFSLLAMLPEDTRW
jgi:AraC-like DNA-binding protein